MRHAHLQGTREAKYANLTASTAAREQWSKVEPAKPFYLITPQNGGLRDEYQKYLGITSIMPVNVLGFQSHRDHFAVAFEKEEIRHRISMMRDAKHTDVELALAFETPDNRDWQLHAARQKARRDEKWEDKIITCLYRPFDSRACYFSTVAMDYPRRELLDHVAWQKNICLNVTRQTRADWRHAVVSDKPAPAVYVELKDGSNIFPLWLYPYSDSLEKERRPNLSYVVLQHFGKDASPEDIFHYIYGVFHSPGYRSRYAEFLKIDFPRVPLTGNLALFRELSRLGGELVALHLLESPLLNTPRTEFFWGAHAPSRVVPGALAGNISPHNEAAFSTEKTSTHPTTPSSARARTTARDGACAPLVTKPGWTDGTVWLDSGGKKAATTPGTCGFHGVPEEVWNFHIGGYQVCEKWLKDRKGRALSAEDIAHYQKIVIALTETIRLMAEIDQVIATHGGWPGAFATTGK